MIDTGNTGNLTVETYSGVGTNPGVTASMSRGNPAGSSEIINTWHRSDDVVPNERLGFTISGTGPVMIRAFSLDYIDEDSEAIP